MPLVLARNLKMLHSTDLIGVSDNQNRDFVKKKKHTKDADSFE
jgi:hypothetical protein